jgi:hypothetical protein
MIILAFLLGGIVAIASAVVWRALQWLEDQRTRPQRWTTVLDPRPREHPEPPPCYGIYIDPDAGQTTAHAMAAAHKASAYGQPPHGPATLARLSPQRLASDLRSYWRPERN